VREAYLLGLFLLATAVALASSHVLILRLERIGARLALTEAALGLLAALAADTPEIATAVTALVNHQGDVGIGVVLGSNVAKLAMLLGLAAVVAGRIRLDRRVVALEGVVAVAVALVSVAVVGHAMSPVPGLVVSLLVFVPYVALLVISPARRALLRIPARLRGTLSTAVRQEEDDLDIHAGRGGRADVAVAVAMLALVIGASVVLEHTGSDLGTAWGLSDLVVGAVLLAIVTSIPNAVAALHLARSGRGAATLATTTNSNTVNVLVGLLLPATLIGLGEVTREATLTAWWYLDLTVVVLAWAYLRRGLGRASGLAIGAAYVVFVALLLR
jgi:cation:H+ antiporter